MSKATRFLWYVGPMIAWMVVIFVMSTEIGSAARTAGLLYKLLQRFFPDWLAQATPEQLFELHYWVRKGAHFTEYFILALLAYRAFRYGEAWRHWRALGFSGSFSILYAFTDEFHQVFISSRTPSLRDVGIDALGAMTGFVLLAALYAWQSVREALQTAPVQTVTRATD
ncbi:MAG: VanZ family protein [Armatimonadota bacterium]|nr:VanZ family protein [bacterium]MDW8321879.1 VanZ family protein [Armatimonadota bacterium]